MTPPTITAPFTARQVDALNRYQRSEFHPFTCRQRAGHPLDPEGDHGVLVATEAGWICRHCPYRQDWAYDFMAGAEFFDVPYREDRSDEEIAADFKARRGSEREVTE